MRSTTSWLSRSSEGNAAQVSRAISVPSVLRPRGRVALTLRPPSTTEPVVLPWRLPARALIRACLGPRRSASSASIICCITTSPVAEVNASRPSLMAPATSARSTLASSGRFTRRAAARAAAADSATVMTGIVLHCGRLAGHPIPRQRQGLGWRTTALFQQTWGQSRAIRSHEFGRTVSKKHNSSLVLPERKMRGEVERVMPEAQNNRIEFPIL